MSRTNSYEQCGFDAAIESIVTEFMYYQMSHIEERTEKLEQMLKEAQDNFIIDSFQIFSDISTITFQVYKDAVMKQSAIHLLSEKEVENVLENTLVSIEVKESAT